MEIAGLVLAAGAGRRYGMPDALATGVCGARDYLCTHAAEVSVVPVADVADDPDLDVPADAGVNAHA
jgi:CTP:molybdopterin cytidylyltransferase MocA